MTSHVPADSAGPGSRDQSGQDSAGPVDNWFGLSSANFLVVHRARLQSMPPGWQVRLVELLEELRAGYADAPDPDFQVTTVLNRRYNELTTPELGLLGVTVEPSDGGPVFIDPLGNQLDGRCLVGMPIADPVPHYHSGYLPPDETAIAALRASR